MMTRRGSQTREPIEDTDYVIDATWPDVDRDSIVLRDADGHRTLWYRNDGYAGYVIVIAGQGVRVWPDAGHDGDRRLRP